MTDKVTHVITQEQWDDNFEQVTMNKLRYCVLNMYRPLLKTMPLCSWNHPGCSPVIVDFLKYLMKSLLLLLLKSLPLLVRVFNYFYNLFRNIYLGNENFLYDYYYYNRQSNMEVSGILMMLMSA